MQYPPGSAPGLDHAGGSAPVVADHQDISVGRRYLGQDLFNDLPVPNDQWRVAD